MSLLAGLVFAFTQHLIELVNKLQQLLRIHFDAWLVRQGVSNRRLHPVTLGRPFLIRQDSSLVSPWVCAILHTSQGAWAFIRCTIPNKFLDPAPFTR
jgi:hypothetical protein